MLAVPTAPSISSITSDLLFLPTTFVVDGDIDASVAGPSLAAVVLIFASAIVGTGSSIRTFVTGEFVADTTPLPLLMLLAGEGISSRNVASDSTTFMVDSPDQMPPTPLLGGRVPKSISKLKPGSIDEGSSEKVSVFEKPGRFDKRWPGGGSIGAVDIEDAATDDVIVDAVSFNLISAPIVNPSVKWFSRNRLKRGSTKFVSFSVFPIPPQFAAGGIESGDIFTSKDIRPSEPALAPTSTALFDEGACASEGTDEKS